MTLLSPGAPPGPAVGTGPVSAPAGRTLSAGGFLLPLLMTVLLLGLPLALFVAPVVAAGGATMSVAVLLFAVIVVYCVVRLGALMWTGEPRWAVLGVWMFSYTWIGVAGLTQSLANANPLGLTLEPAVATEQSALLLFGLICFDVASRASDTRSDFLVAPSWRGRLHGRVLSPARVLWLAVVALVLSPVFVGLLGGTTALLSSREAVTDTLAESGLYTDSTNAAGGFLFALAGALPFVALLCLVRLLAQDRAVRRRVLPWALAVGLVAANVVLNNPISNARYWAFAVVLAFFFAWRATRRPTVIVLFVSAFTVSSLTLFPYLDAYRYSEETTQTQAQYSVSTSALTDPVDYVLGKTDYASVTDVAVIIRYVGNEGHTWGRQLLGAAAFWVPRPLWPDKPDNTAFLVADEIGFSNRNLDSPLWAEGYVDFGWIGTALLLAGAGLAARRLDDAFVRLPALPTVPSATAIPLAAVAVPALAGYEYILLRGSLLQAMARVVVVVGLLLLVSHRPASRPTGRVPDHDSTPDPVAVPSGASAALERTSP